MDERSGRAIAVKRPFVRILRGDGLSTENRLPVALRANVADDSLDERSDALPIGGGVELRPARQLGEHYGLALRQLVVR